MIDLGNGNSIAGYRKINVILGKNGSGKSTLLRLMDSRLSGKDACIRYITPERGGELTYDGNIETNRSHNPNWMTNTRRKNRWEQFRQSSVAEFRNLETLVLRSIERDSKLRATDFKFDAEVDRINEVLERVSLVRADTAGFDIALKDGGNTIKAADLSSGESELISLAVEVLYFAYLCKQEKYRDQDNWLLLDEPDVHLHPDLQYRLMQLLVNSTRDANGRIAIATHSTSILSGLCSLSEDVRVGLKHFGPNALEFRSVDDAMRSVLPMFGAHPLSNVFNEKPPLILEGEDDERIWQAAVRRSNGRISVYPCVASDIQSMNQYEVAARDLIESVYDDARAFSLRDRDSDPYEIDDMGPIIRMRLNCRNAENLIVTDDVLAELGTDWTSLRGTLEKWISDNPDHSRFAAASAFRDSGWKRQNFQLKELRMLLVGLTGSNKPWEVAVGQAIAKLPENRFNGGHSLREYLGTKAVRELGLLA
ncbi:AAA family ATPase [Thioclava atlantica]|uniref:AAA family ATPase n=1 Tax=Thioclava atlantica TaxID=1317124 RepID=UPI000A86189F|nr:AAA family ATPase [Thioclava atlantica]